MIKKTFTMISLLLTRILAFIISGTRPLLGPAKCNYSVGCTDYTLEQLRTQTILKACWNSTKRILSCNPFNKHRRNT